MAYRIAILNNANVSAAEIDAFIPAVNMWINQLAQYWPIVAGSYVYSPQRPAPADAWLLLTPMGDQANSLGYHQLTSNGLPMGTVELDNCRKYNWPWTIAASHEIGEMLVNAHVDQYVMVGSNWYMKEICDPVTSDQMTINGVQLSNAVTPAWFNPQGTGAFDLLGSARSPIPTIPPNGWMEWYDGVSWKSAYGTAITTEYKSYMQARVGRRAMMKQQFAGISPQKSSVPITFDFSEALHKIKAGKKVARSGWDGKDMYIFLTPGNTHVKSNGTEVEYHSHIDMKTAQGYIIPWLASQADLIDEDWVEIHADTLPENDSP